MLLDGVRVLDLSRLLPGGYCTQLLQVQGAQVTKIEPPAGDPIRALPGGNAYFEALQDIWTSRSYKIAEYLVAGMYPAPLATELLQSLREYDKLGFVVSCGEWTPEMFAVGVPLVKNRSLNSLSAGVCRTSYAI